MEAPRRPQIITTSHLCLLLTHVTGSQLRLTSSISVECHAALPISAGAVVNADPLLVGHGRELIACVRVGEVDLVMRDGAGALWVGEGTDPAYLALGEGDRVGVGDVGGGEGEGGSAEEGE